MSDLDLDLDDGAGRAYEHRLGRRLITYLRPYRGQVAAAVVVTLAAAAIQLAYPWLTKEAIDLGIRHRDTYVLDRIALAYLSALLMGMGLGYLQTQVMQRVGQGLMVDLRSDLFRHLQRLPVSYFDSQPIGRLMTRVTNDVEVLNEMFTAGIDALFGDLFILTGIVVAMAQLNVELLVVTFSVLPVMVLVTLTFRVKVRRAFRDVRSCLARLNSFLNENLGGMSTVQLLGREARNHAEFSDINAAHRDANLRANRYHAVFFPLLEFVSAMALALIVWYGGRQVMWTGITLGTLVAFIQYTQRFFRPLSDLSEKYGILQQAMASAERIFELLDTPTDVAAVALPARNGAAAAGAGRPAPAAVTTGLAPSKPGMRVEFDHVWFAYNGERWVLEDVSLTLEPGERVAIVAPRARARPRSPACSCASTLRSGARSGWMGGRSPTGSRPSSGAGSGSCSRMCSCSRARSRATSRSAIPRSTRAAPARRRARCTPTTWSSGCPAASTPRCASAGPRSRQGSASCWRSRAHSPAARSSWCWTRRPRAWTRTPSG